jgi:putative ABC transport system permease protein
MNPILADVRDGIRSQPGRAGLSFGILAVGMAALTILLALLGGLREKSRHLIREFGAQAFAVLSPEAGPGMPAALRESDAALLAANLPDCFVSTVRRVEWPADGVGPAAVLATDQRLAEIRGWEVVSGRFLDAQDVRRAERHAVITRHLSEDRGWNVGQVVSLKGVPFTIVGIVTAESGALESAGADRRLAVGARAVLVPKSTVGLLMDQDSGDARGLDAVLIRAPEQQSLDRVLTAARRILSSPDGRASGWSWVTPDTLVRRLRKLQTMIGVTAGVVALLCLILGGTTLMSLTVANVAERVAEIGLRRAMGARPSDIVGLFMLEACLISGSAAALAAGVTGAALFVVRTHFPLPLHLGASTVLLPLVLSLALSAVFSIGPARSAARISPADALKSE